MSKPVAITVIKPAYYRQIIMGAGIMTFFFGFAAGAILNIVLLLVNSPLVTHYRTTLTYKSAIFGDGIILPFINMLATAFLLKHRHHISKKTLTLSCILGFAVTAYFHITQAMGNIVNWAMPTPWHWNFIGAWHAVYMFSVCSLLSLYYLVLIHSTRKNRRLTRESFLVTVGIVFFFLLLHLDYLTVNLKQSFVSDFQKTKNNVATVAKDGKEGTIRVLENVSFFEAN